MLNTICIRLKKYKQHINIEETVKITRLYSECNADDTLVVADTMEELQYAVSGNYAVLYISGENEYVDGAQYVTDSLEECDYDYLRMVFCRQKGLPMRILETKRTWLREMTVEDLDELYRIYDDDQVRRYLEPLYPYEQEKEFTVNYIHNMYGLYGYGLWLVFDKADGRMIGRAGISVRTIDGEDRNELGYILRREYRRQGYAYEVCQGIMNYAFNKLKMEDLLIVTDKRNLPSCDLAEKLGFWSLGSSKTAGCEFMIFQYKE